MFNYILSSFSWLLISYFFFKKGKAIHLETFIDAILSIPRYTQESYFGGRCFRLMQWTSPCIRKVFP